MKFTHVISLVLQKKIKKYTQNDIFLYTSHIFISIVLGTAAGGGAILFHTLLDKMKYIFNPEHFNDIFQFNITSYVIIAIPILGGLITATMTRYFKKFSHESGVNGVIKSILLNNGYLNFRSTLFHLFAPIISIGSGAPLGPEGPAARLGSGIGSVMSKIFKLNNKDMRMYVVAGAGAAISAIFNAPIAGVFFGIEVILLNDMKNQAISALIISSVVADVLSRAILGSQHILQIPSYHPGSLSDFPFYLILGIACGLITLIYFWVMKKTNYLLNEKLKIKNEFLKIIPITFLFGIILINFYELFGLGYGTLNSIINGQYSLTTLIILLILKLIFVALFLNGGSYGGTFAPSLSMGAMTGYIFALILNSVFDANLDPVTFSLVAMGGVLSGVNSIPITSILLVFEITNDYKFILPLMFVSIISYLVTLHYNKGTVYEMELLEDGIDVSKRGEVDILGKIDVKELMIKNFHKVSYKLQFKKLIDAVMSSKSGDVFIVDDNNRLMGIVSLRDIREALVSNELVDLLIAGDVISEVPIVTEDEKVSSAMDKIDKYNLENIPVVSGDGSYKIVGNLTHESIIQAYNRQLREWETDQFLIDYKKE